MTILEIIKMCSTLSRGEIIFKSIDTDYSDLMYKDNHLYLYDESDGYTRELNTFEILVFTEIENKYKRV